MDGHFRAFSFVDRIVAVQPGVSIRGTYRIPAGLAEFPVTLVFEAVGQIAAWSAMAALDFKVRQIAGLASHVELLSGISPGQTLELAAEIQTAELDAVAYCGTAHVDGKPVVRLENCVGPMMPLEEFNDPQTVREHFNLLCGTGATPGGFDGLPPLEIEYGPGETAHWKSASLRVPSSAPFFADHFPRRPVFPGTLLMQTNLQLATALAAEIPTPANGGHWRLNSISNVKLRTFTLPGEILEIRAKVGRRMGDTVEIMVESRNGSRLVGSAQAYFAPEARR